MSTPADTPRPEIVMVSTKYLKIHAWHQANVPSSNNADKVAADMRIYGFRREHPLLVSSLSGTVLDGATRLSIATTSYLPANYLLPLAEVPAIVVPCETVQDEIDTIARTVLTTRQLTPGQYELLAYTYMKTLSATLVQAQKSGAGKKKGKKKNGSAGSADPLAVKGPEVVTATSPDAVVEKQHRRDARAETAVPEPSLSRCQELHGAGPTNRGNR